MHPPTYAAGVRLPFSELPDEVASWIAQTLGGPITNVVDKQGGFSPGVAAVVQTAAGARGFIKAVGTSINAESVRFHRAENAVMARMPVVDSVLRPVASQSIQIDADEWEVTILPVIDGMTPPHPWSDADARRVLDAVVELGEQLTPSPWPEDREHITRLTAFFRGWTRISRDEADDTWRERAWVATHLPDLVTIETALIDQLPGTTLSHCDLRADNVLLTEDRVWFVDWAHAGNAARWLDPVLLLADVIASGSDRGDGGEIDVTALLAGHEAFAGVDEWIVWGVLATLAATLHFLSRLPDPPGLPTIRRYQDLTAESIVRFVVRHQPDGLPPPHHR